MIEELARLSVEVDYASEFRYRDPGAGRQHSAAGDLTVGRTADTIAALREVKERGGKVLSICNGPGFDDHA